MNRMEVPGFSVILDDFRELVIPFKEGVDCADCCKCNGMVCEGLAVPPGVVTSALEENEPT